MPAVPVPFTRHVRTAARIPDHLPAAGSPGKVRDIYAVGDDKLLIVTPTGPVSIRRRDADTIPGKGEVLTQVSAFWFDKLKAIVPARHSISRRTPWSRKRARPGAGGRSWSGKLKACGRSHRARLPGGIGWKEYQSSQSVCGIALPAGLAQADRLPAPASPRRPGGARCTRREHSFDQMGRGDRRRPGEQVRDVSLALYQSAAEYALTRGIIIADTKFEFGLDEGGAAGMIDEALTPDSSRFWPPTSTGRAATRPVSTSSSCATGWKPAAGTSRHRDRRCPTRSSPRPARNTARRCSRLLG